MQQAGKSRKEQARTRVSRSTSIIAQTIRPSLLWAEQCLRKEDIESLNRSSMPLHSTRPLVRPQLVKRTQCSFAEATALFEHHGRGGDARTRVAYQDPPFHVGNHHFSRISLPVLYDSRRCFAAQTLPASNLEQQQAKPRVTLSVLSHASLTHRSSRLALGILPPILNGCSLAQKRSRRFSRTSGQIRHHHRRSVSSRWSVGPRRIRSHVSLHRPRVQEGRLRQGRKE